MKDEQNKQRQQQRQEQDQRRGAAYDQANDARADKQDQGRNPQNPYKNK